MKAKKNVKVVVPQGIIRKLILHFNIDKTIIMRDTLGYNNSDFMVNNYQYLNHLNLNFLILLLQIREILSELIWGKPDVNKKGEEYFKVEHKQLEFDKNNVEEGLMTFAQYLDEKFHPLTQEEYDSLEQKEKSLEEMNQERKSEKIKI